MFKKVIELAKKLWPFSFSICGLLSGVGRPKTRVLITRPDHDPTTSYLFAWAQPMIDLVSSKDSFELFCLEKTKACRREFLRLLKKKPTFIFFNGHGTAYSVTGYNNEPLVTMGNDEKHYQSKLIYALSCKSARSLGKYLVDFGVKAYLGYKDDFIFIVEEDKLEKPLEDETAKLYLEPSNILVSSILEGETAGEAYQKSQEKFQENINVLLTTESTDDDRDLAPYLYWDMEHQVCLGDKEAKI